MNVALVIPTYNAGSSFKLLLQQIKKQTLVPKRVLVIDSSSTDETVELARQFNCEVKVIEKSQFNHGGTRQLAVEELQNDSEFIMFITQDVLLYDVNTFANILTMISTNPNMGAAYGRQIPHKGASIDASIQREFNYPGTSIIKSVINKKKLGIKVAFLSNSFAIYNVDCLLKVGGFPLTVVACEDMYVAAKMLLESYTIGYCAEAKVYHSHEYSLKEDWKRYYITGKFQKEEGWIEKAFGCSESEGVKLLVKQIERARSLGGLFTVVSLVSKTAFRYMAYKIGKS